MLVVQDGRIVAERYRPDFDMHMSQRTWSVAKSLAGTVIGAAFDGNIHSLGGNYGYDPTLNRTVVVSAAAVDEALRNIYPAPALLAELRRR